MVRRATFAAMLAVLFLVSPPARAPTLNVSRAFDADPLLGPWPVEQMLPPCAGPAGVAAGQLPRPEVQAAASAADLLRPSVDRLNQAWASLRSSLDRAAPALRAGLNVLSELAARAGSGAMPPAAERTPSAPGPDAAFMRRHFDDLFRPQAAGPSPPGGTIDLADVFVKMTAIAFLGAIVLVPAGCARVSVVLYGHARDSPAAAG